MVQGAELHRRFPIGEGGFEIYRGARRFSIVTANPFNNTPQLTSIDHLIDNLLVQYGDGKPADEFEVDDGGGQHPKANPADPGERLTAAEVEKLIEKGAPVGKRSQKFQAVVWWLAARHHRVRDILAQFATHPDGIAKKYQGRLNQEVERCYAKWLNLRRDRGAGYTVNQTGTWPEIECIAGETPRMIREAERALLKMPVLHFYTRGHRLVRPLRTKLFTTVEDENGERINRETTVWTVSDVEHSELDSAVSVAARFLRFNKRDGLWVQTDPPKRVVTGLLERKVWQLPVLTNITTAPFLGADGSIVSTPGYDPATGILLLPAGEQFPPIPEKPTLADARAARAKLSEAFETFPFGGKTDAEKADALAVVLSGILSGLDRHVCQNIPLHSISAPKQGSGKTMLADMIGTIVNGYPPATMVSGDTPEELTKRFDTLMLTSANVILIDNLTRPLKNEAISMCLTRETYTARVLGESRAATVPADVLVLATGNNLVVHGDLRRRVIECRLDPGVEKPETRHFDFNPLIRARRQRPELVAAALTLQRAYLISGDRVTTVPMGSFETWSRRVQEAILWAGGGDACTVSEGIKQADPDELAFDRLIDEWKRGFGTRVTVTAKQVAERAQDLAAHRVTSGNYASPDNTEFLDLLKEIAPNRRGDSVDVVRFGHWLGYHRDRISNKFRLTSAGENRRHQLL
jgi:hypothetical protein